MRTWMASCVSKMICVVVPSCILLRAFEDTHANDLKMQISSYQYRILHGHEQLYACKRSRGKKIFRQESKNFLLLFLTNVLGRSAHCK